MYNDIVEFFWSLNLGIVKHNLEQITLGKVKNNPLYLLQPRTFDSSKPNLLIAAGFHGNEIAGPWGLVYFMNSTETLPCNLSFLPLANPTGFISNSRYNAYGQSPNNGWIHENILSEEGTIIKGHIEQILPLAKDGFLTLHEDLDHNQFYLYCVSKDKPSEMVPKLIQTGSRYFGVVEDSYYIQKEKSLVPKVHIQKGLVHNVHDGSFEDYMFHQGVPETICTETPLKDSLEKRISATIDLIKVFIARSTQGNIWVPFVKL